MNGSPFKRKREFETYESNQMVFGIRAIIEAIKSGKEIENLFLQRGLTGGIILELRSLLKDHEIGFQLVPIEKLNRLTTKNHQGAVAFISPISYDKIENIIPLIYEKGEVPLILILDGITDVRNFGAIARTAECEGVDAILIPSKGSALVSSDAMKASAGALNRIPVCKSDNLKDSIFYLQQSGLRIVACTEKTAAPLYEVNLRGSVAIILGSEENGITQDLINMSDIRARIPMKGTISSLNVGVATGMVLYEKIRQELYG